MLPPELLENIDVRAGVLVLSELALKLMKG